MVELLIVVTIIGIVSAIALPGLVQARKRTNEASAIQLLRTIGVGEAAVIRSTGRAATLAEMGTSYGSYASLGLRAPSFSVMVFSVKAFVMVVQNTAIPSAPTPSSPARAKPSSGPSIASSGIGGSGRAPRARERRDGGAPRLAHTHGALRSGRSRARIDPSQNKALRHPFAQNYGIPLIFQALNGRS